MSKDTVMEARNPEKGTRDDVTDLLCEGAKRLTAEAVDAELSATLAQFADYKDEGQVTGTWFATATCPKREASTGIRGCQCECPRSQRRTDRPFCRRTSGAFRVSRRYCPGCA